MLVVTHPLHPASGLSPVQDLVHAHAERARACLLLADRFTTDPEQEDLSILFQASWKRA